MAETSSIEWTDATWNPVTGCSVISPGCTNCYAMKVAGTRLRNHASRKDLTAESKAGPVWNGQVRVNEGWLTQPLEWTKPRKIFVCAHGDLFHENVPDAVIDRVFAVMAAAPKHTFQVLTKRSARMRAYLTAPGVLDRIRGALRRLGAECDAKSPLAQRRTTAMAAAGWNAWAAEKNLELGNGSSSWPMWPLNNLWLGVSTEDQDRWNTRVPDLLWTPAARRFVSVEPMLGPIDPTVIDLDGHFELYPLAGSTNCETDDGEPAPDVPALNWIIVGGESGPGARPMHPDWARSIRDDCAEAGVAFFFKQWGTWAPGEACPDLKARDCAEFFNGAWSYDRQPAGPSDDHIDDEPDVYRIGKKAAGRLLDGVEHNDMPVPA